MKSLPFVLFLISLSAAVAAQSGAAKPATSTRSDTAKPAVPARSDAQRSFEKLKTLAGVWEGPVTTDMPRGTVPMEDKPMQVSLRTTSRGNALLHEMTSAGSPDDPITMFYLDADRLLLTHYCDAGNRPRMTGRMSPDGKKVEFDFLDLAGSTQYGHMQHAVFTLVDADHHTEDWTFLLSGDKPIHAHFDLHRKN